MAPKTSGTFTEELIKAFQDDSVRAIFGPLLEKKLRPFMDSVNLLT
jgi:hypothetical protein